MWLIEAFVRNPVKITVAVLLMVLFGTIALFQMPMQLTPEVQIPTITVETRWPGADPQQVEKEIIIEQEEYLKSVEGLTKLTSESSDGSGKITLEFRIGTNIDEALLKVNSNLQQVPEYPEDADQPVISTSNSSDRPIAWFILGPRRADEQELNRFAAEHPELAEAVERIRLTDNRGLMLLRLRELAKKHPEAESLLPDYIRDAKLTEFAKKNPDLTAGANSIRSEPRHQARIDRVRELIDNDPRYAELIPASLDVPTLRRFTEDYIEARFERVPGVSNSNVFGGLEDEVQVVVDPQRLAARQLSIADLRRVLRSQSKDVSGGDIWEDKRRWVVRTLGQYRNLADVENQLVAVKDGAPIYVRDVADVQYGFKKPNGIVRRFGESRIAVNCERETGANVLDVMSGLKATLAELNEGVLKDRGLEMTQVYDETEYIYSAVELVQENIFIGGALTMIVLMLFLHRSLKTLIFSPAIALTAVAAAYVSPWFFAVTLVLILLAGFWFARGALVVGLAIPTSIIGTFLILSALGRSLNVISLAGLAFAVGMLVDNAVVVLENIYSHYHRGASPFQACIRGTHEVWGAVVASTITTIAVFLPVVFVQEEAGQLFRDIALAISSAVGLSLLVSVTLIPMASARLFDDDSEDEEPEAASAQSLAHGNGHQGNGHEAHASDEADEETAPTLGQRISGAILWPLETFGWLVSAIVVGLNRWVQGGTLRRLIVATLMVAVAVGTAYVLWPKVEYLPRGNRNLVFGILVPPPGYNQEQLMALGQTVEDELRPHWDLDPERDPNAKGPAIGDFFFVARGRSVFMGVKSVDPLRAQELEPLVRQATAGLPGTVGIANQSSLFERGLEGGRSIDIEIMGPDLEKLVSIGQRIFVQTKTKLGDDAQAIPKPSLDLASPELQVKPKLLQSAEMNVRTDELGYAVDALVDGAYAADYYLGGDKIDVTIKGTPELAKRTQDLASLPIAVPSGQLVPLEALADVDLASGPEQINHRETLRAITIQVNPPPSMPIEQAMEIITTEIVGPIQESGELGNDYMITLAGTADKLQNTWNALKWNIVLALLITYLLMAALYESWLYPFVIIFSVPLGAVGGIVGLTVLNIFTLQTLDVLTMLGFIILIGTVVNNAILIVDQALHLIRSGESEPKVAIVQAVESRIRPIFMTTTTTVLGLLPLVLFPGAGSELYRGLGSVVLGGLLVSTVFTLLLVPTVFTLTLDTKNLVLGFARATRRKVMPSKKRRRPRTAAAEAPQPAGSAN